MHQAHTLKHTKQVKEITKINFIKNPTLKWKNIYYCKSDTPIIYVGSTTQIQVHNMASSMLVEGTRTTYPTRNL